MTSHESDFAALKPLLLELSGVHDLPRLLDLLVRRLEELLPLALARVWLLAPGDRCGSCPMRAACHDRERCLHLEASAGTSRDGTSWERLDGAFSRVPLGARKVGHVAATRQTVEVVVETEGPQWLADPEWARREGVRGFIGQPLLWKGELLGVLGLFLRTPLAPEARFWSRLVADHTAASIATSRAFAEIERLRQQLARENQYLREEVRRGGAFGAIVGESPAMGAVLDQIALVAPTASSVLISGESGTGKELVARAIHARSPRSERTLVKVNCASIPPELFESEFFGHVQGAFTGAVRDREGRFALADGGTLFLDEVGELPRAMQGKLLRVLQEGTYERVGEARPRRADVRIIAATNQDLAAAARAGDFRQDLYYRLQVFPIEVPPLRERPGDVALLARRFLADHAAEQGLSLRAPTAAELEELAGYPWPGNVRELQNFIERAVILARGGPLRLRPPLATLSAPAAAPPSERLLSDAEMRVRARANVLAVVRAAGWKIAGPGGAAERLGVHPATLRSRMKAMGIRRPS